MKIIVTRAGLHLSLMGLGLVASGCTVDNPEPKVGSLQSAIEEDSMLPGYYAVSPAPVGASLVMAQRASGTVFTPNLDPTATYAGSRFTCGVTFVSPTIAVTAAHCVDTIAPNGTVNVDMYNLAADVDWQQATDLNTAFSYPNWQHGTISSGYSTDTYACQVVQRCGDLFSPFNCACGFPGAGPGGNCDNATLSATSDVAILVCDSQPGCTYDYVNQRHLGPTAGYEPLTAVWAHEVYDVPVGPPNGTLGAHYTKVIFAEPDDNYHYLGGTYFNAQLGQVVPRNQLLPLVSTPWASAEHYAVDNVLVKLGNVNNVDVYVDSIRTDILGCHGTSGSGIFTQVSWAGDPPQLVGPVTNGNESYVNLSGTAANLCNDPAEGGGSKFGPGKPALAFVNSFLVWQQVQWAYQNYPEPACPSPGGGASVMASTPGYPLFFSEFDLSKIPEVIDETVTVEEWTTPWQCGACTSSCPPCTPWARLRMYNEPMITMPKETAITLGEAEFDANATYRVSFQADGFGDTPEFALYIDEVDMTSSLRPLNDRNESSSAGTVVAEFSPSSSGSFEIKLVMLGGAPSAGVTDFALAVDGGTNTFDSRMERVSVGLDLGGSHVEPMRFELGSNSKFQALLRGGERMTLSRLAMTPGNMWSIELRTGEQTHGMRCGILMSNGEEIQENCDNGAVVLGTSSSSVPIAVFIELPTSHNDVAIDDVAVTKR